MRRNLADRFPGVRPNLAACPACAAASHWWDVGATVYGAWTFKGASSKTAALTDESGNSKTITEVTSGGIGWSSANGLYRDGSTYASCLNTNINISEIEWLAIKYSVTNGKYLVGTALTLTHSDTSSDVINRSTGGAIGIYPDSSMSRGYVNNVEKYKYSDETSGIFLVSWDEWYYNNVSSYDFSETKTTNDRYLHLFHAGYDRAVGQIHALAAFSSALTSQQRTDLYNNLTGI